MLLREVVLVSRSKNLGLASMLFWRHQERLEIEFSCWMFSYCSPHGGIYMILSGDRQ
jgi:hypothetical protein